VGEVRHSQRSSRRTARRGVENVSGLDRRRIVVDQASQVRPRRRGSEPGRAESVARISRISRVEWQHAGLSEQEMPTGEWRRCSWCPKNRRHGFHRRAFSCGERLARGLYTTNARRHPYEFIAGRAARRARSEVDDLPKKSRHLGADMDGCRRLGIASGWAACTLLRCRQISNPPSPPF